MIMHSLRDVLRAIQRELTSLLLAGAMLAPIAAAIVGWPVQTPLDVPLRMYVALLVAVGMVAFGVAGRDDPVAARRRRLGWLLVPPFAVTFAAIVHERANVFYTERVLVDGMTALFILHLAVRVLRGRAHCRTDVGLGEHEATWRWRRGAEWRRRIRSRCLPATPGVRLADALTMAVGWLVLVSWVLIAREHRHPAGPLLLAAGAMEALAFLALIPDALAGSGWLGPRRVSAPRPPRGSEPVAVDDEPPARPPLGTHLSGRHS